MALTTCYKDETRQHEYEKYYPALPSLPPTIMSLGRMQYREMDDDELSHRYKESEFLFRSTMKQSSGTSIEGDVLLHQNLVPYAVLLLTHHHIH